MVEDNTDYLLLIKIVDDEDVDDKQREPFDEESHANVINLRIVYSKTTPDEEGNDTVRKVSQTATNFLCNVQ